MTQLPYDSGTPKETLVEEDRAWVVIWRIEKKKTLDDSQGSEYIDYYLNEYLDGTRDMYWALKATTLALACAWVEEHHQQSLDNKESHVSSLTIKEVSLKLAGRNCLKQPE